MPECTYDPSVWEVVDGRVTRYLGDDPIVIVPKELSYICKDTFYLSNALFVCFPNADTYLEEGAFYNDVCLKKLTLPNGLLHIGEFCFFKIKNMTVHAPRTLKVHIEQYYFEDSRDVGVCCTVFPPDVSSIFESDAKIHYFERTVTTC